MSSRLDTERTAHGRLVIEDLEVVTRRDSVMMMREVPAFADVMKAIENLERQLQTGA